MLKLYQAALLIITQTTLYSVLPGATHQARRTMHDVMTSKYAVRDEFCATVCGREIDCTCDRECIHYKDCCKNHNVQEPLNTSVYQLFRYMKCMKVVWTGTNFVGDGYQMIGQCPKSWKDEYTRVKCHQLENNNVLENIPLFSNSAHVTYRNMYCAACHGVRKNDLKPWNSQIKCSKFVHDKMSSLMTQINSYIESGQCIFKSFLTSIDEKENYQRLCFENSSKYIDRCSAEYEGRTKELCDAYRATITITYRNVENIYRVYRNPDCLKCDDSVIDESLTQFNYYCTDTPWRMNDSYWLYLTLHFASLFYGPEVMNPKSILRCNDNEALIQRLGQCVTLHCPEVSTAQGGECITYERTSNWALLNLVFYAEGDAKDEAVKDELLNIVDTFNSRRSCSIFLSLRMQGEPVIVRGVQHGSDEKHCIYASITAELTETATGELYKEKMMCIEIYFQSLRRASNVSLSYIDNTNKTLCYTNYEPRLHLPFVRFPDYIVKKQVHCPAIEVYEDNNMTIANKSSITYYIGDIVLNANHVSKADSGYYICLSSFKMYYGNALTSRPTESSSRYKAIVSYTSMGVSMLSLSITLVHYCFIPKMLTPHGSLLLHIGIIMLLTHSTYILSANSYPNSIQCWWVGVILHVLFLSLMLAIESSLLQITLQLRNMVNPFTQKGLKKTIVKYIIPCYILVLFIIGTTLVVNNLVYSNDVWYGSEHCFVTRPSVLFYTFALPVGFCLGFNICIFVTLVRFLYAMSSTNDITTITNRKLFWLSVILSTLMDVSLVIEFVAALTRVEILEIVFEVASSLQGLVLSMSLLSNTIVREWYQIKFSRNTD